MVISNGISTHQLQNNQYTPEIERAHERVITGENNNHLSDDSAAAIISISLGTRVSSLSQNIENANSGLLVVQSSQQALTSQREILENVRAQLLMGVNSSSSGLEAIRVSIQEQLNQFNDLASQTHGNLYTLQESQSSTNQSLAHEINVTASATVQTPQIQSNTNALNLESLRTVGAGVLTDDMIHDELAVLNEAIKSVTQNSARFDITQDELRVSLNHSQSLKEGTAHAQEEFGKVNVPLEEQILENYRVLVESSKYALVQANIKQERVLDLLTNIPEYEPKPVQKDTSTDEKVQEKKTTVVSSDSSSTVGSISSDS